MLFKRNRSRRPLAPTYRCAVVQPLEPRRLLAGNVAVTVNPGGNILRIIGDNANNEIDISLNETNGHIVVTPTDGTTTINGGAMFSHGFVAPPSIRMRLQDGDDSVTGALALSMPADADARPVIDEGFFRLGRGNDTFDVEVDYLTLLTVIGDSGNDDIDIDAFNYESRDSQLAIRSQVQDNLDDPLSVEPRVGQPAMRVFGFDGDDEIMLSGSAIVGGILLDGGNQDDVVDVFATNTIGQSRFDMGAGNDSGFFRSAGQEVGRFVFKGRTGNDSMLFDGFNIDYAGADTQPFRFDGDTGDDVVTIARGGFTAVRGVQSGGGLITESSGTFFYLGGVGRDRLYMVSSSIEAGGFEYDQGPDDDSFLMRAATIDVQSNGLPGGVPTLGGGRFLSRGRGENDVFVGEVSSIDASGRVIFDGDAGDDAVISEITDVTAGSNLTIAGDRGEDLVVVATATIDATTNLDINLGNDDDNVLLCSFATVNVGGSFTVDAGADIDRISIAAGVTVPAATSQVGVEDGSAAAAPMETAAEDILDTRGVLWASDPESAFWSSIAANLC